MGQDQASGSRAGVKLTGQQRRALEVVGTSVALAAGAGCGKTMVLTERFLSSLEGGGGRALCSLTALTFTEKAARELRRRVRARCRAELSSSSTPQSHVDRDAGRWLNILRGLGAAPIGTFHGFCAQLLRQHALLAGVDPEFTIIDESVAGSLRDEAVGAVLRRALAERAPDLIAIGADFGLRAVRETVFELSAESDSDGLEEWAALEPQAIVERWRAFFAGRLWPIVLDQARGPLDDCARALEALDSDHEKIRARRDELLSAMRRLPPDAPPCPAACLEEVADLARVNNLPRKNLWPSEAAHEAIKGAFTVLRDHINKKALPSLDWDEAAALAAAERGLRFAHLALEAQREHRAIKRRRGALDFNDLIQTARALLRDHPEVAAAPLAGAGVGAPAFEFVMVDEFQDTDEAQSEILRRLCGPEFPKGKLFIVGDVKQSIYRFRGARPAIFGQWRAEFPESSRLTLSENFRSVPGVVHFANALFDGCFDALDPGRGTVGPDDGHRLAPTRERDIAQPTIEFLWPDLQETEADQGPPGGPSMEPGPRENAGEDDGLPDDAPRTGGQPRERLLAHDRRAIEARCLARRLRDRLEAGWMVQGGPDGTGRRARPGDIVLLFRAMTDLAPYELALAAEGFDYLTIGGSAFYAQQEVLDVINILSVLDDPFDEVALAGALRGPFFSVSDEGLYWLATARIEGARRSPAASAGAMGPDSTVLGPGPGPFAAGGLTANLQRVELVPNLSPLDRRRAERAREQLAQWRALKDRMPMARLLERVLDESGFEAAIVCDVLGERKLANARKIVRMARDFDRQGGFTLAHLVSRLRAYLKDELREEQAATADESSDSLRLMSIHQAKGLEFPIVVVPDLARASGPRSPRAVFHPELGLVSRPPRDAPSTGSGDAEPSGASFPLRAHQLLERIEDDRESLRLFYVAVTRARDSLVLSAGHAADEPAPARAVAFRLLDERFERATGEPRAVPPGGPPAPFSIHVERMKPPASHAGRLGPGEVAGAPTALRAQRRMAIADIAGAIARTTTIGPPVTGDVPLEVTAGVPSEATAGVRSRPPRYVELGPGVGLATRAARLNALVAAILCAPRRSRAEPLAAVAERVARRQAPAPSSFLMREALERAARLQNLPAFTALHAADRATVGLDVEFTIELALASPASASVSVSTVFHGRCDALFRDQQGDWRLINITDVATDGPRERLRLLVAARAAAARGTSPIVQAWLIAHGPSGEAEVRALETSPRRPGAARVSRSEMGPAASPGPFWDRPLMDQDDAAIARLLAELA